VGANAYWVILRNCPTRNETACLTFDGNNDVNVTFFNGTSWSSVTEVCTDADDFNNRNVDIAYEQSTGDALIVYYDRAANTFRYRTYNGTTLSSASTSSRSGISGNDYISLYPNPNSDQIVMITLGQVSGNDPVISANIWDGSSWQGWTTIENTTPSNDDECFSFAFESLSGDGLLVYGESGSSQPRYRTLSGTTWSSEGSLPSTGGAPWWISMASDPSSDQILFAGLDSTNDMNMNAWNGSSWGSNSEVETSVPGHDRRYFDLTYQPEGTNALLAYVENGQTRLRYRTWNGSSWSSEQTGTDLGNQGRTVELRTSTASGEIFIAASDNGTDIESMRWNGSSMSSKTQIEGTHGGLAATEMFMIAAPATPLVPANIPYVTDFQSTVGPEWSSTTTSTNGTYTTFLGRFNNSTAKLALNTTIGTPYSLSFDLYCVDSWEGNDATYGPDYFNVSTNGTQVFHNTFVHEWPAYGMTYPYPYDQLGNYGYDSGYQDAIYRKVEVVFTATGTVTRLSFTGSLSEALDNESWGIDNVSFKTATFVDVSSTKGFNVQNSTSADTYGGGIHWADLDGDGDLDAILSGNTTRLLINNNSGSSFTGSSLGDLRRQFALLDIDNDGDIDFWTGCAGGPDTESCRLNNGSASFTNSDNLGFSSPSNSEGMAAADVNGDGWCDMVMFSGNNNWIGRHTGSMSPALTESNSSGDGLNAGGDYGDGDYCSAGDVNNDKLLDFFYHYSSGKLFVSDGTGTYTRNNYGISVTTGSTKKIGSAWADYDNDGDLDLFCPRYDETCTGYLWRNDRNWTSGSGNFTNVTSSAGFNLNSSVDYTPDKPGTRSCAWGDYDNDGYPDPFIAGPNGNNYLYHNQGNGTFLRVAEGTTMSGAFIDAVFVDYDNDGDLDLCLTRENGAAVLLENRTNNGNYLKVRVLGGGSGKTNKAAIGTRVELWNSTGTTLLARRDIGLARGFGGTEPLWAHFGGVTPSATYQVKVYFQSGVVTKTLVPSSTSTTIGSTVIPKMLTVTESAAKVTKWIEVPNRAS